MCWLVGAACVRTIGKPGIIYLFIVRLLGLCGVQFSLCLGSSGCFQPRYWICWLVGITGLVDVLLQYGI